MLKIKTIQIFLNYETLSGFNKIYSPPCRVKGRAGAAAGYFLKGIAHTTLTGTGLPSIFPGVQSGILLKILMAS